MKFSNPVLVSQNRVAEMARTHEPEEIAEILGVHLDLITQMLAQMGTSGKWILICEKTGRWWRCFSERGCYTKAMVLGLVDYNFGRARA